jgi:DNA helicase-2/ATP-dependent DNA helicase PcrA
MSWNEGLDGVHLEIAQSDSSRIGVLAGPGTGKTTRGLMRRVARLLAEGVPGERILLLSFTRVAAADLRDKVAELDVPGAEAVRATTLHSYCLGLLRREAILELTGRTPRILLEHERDLMLRDIGEDFGTIYERREQLRAFEAGWARRTDDHPGSVELPEDRVFEASVLRWLRDHRAMLIGEVVPIAYSYVTQNPAAEELQAFDHLIVDEYQDLNSLEQSLLDTLAGEETSLCVAGDDDQSIYTTMRFAHPEGIREFLARDETTAFEIVACGRCPHKVLAMANALIGCAPDRD